MSLIEQLSQRELAHVVAAGTRVTVPQGWSLMWERTPADKAYLVRSGEVAIRRDGVEVARLGPGDVVGETAIVEHRLRTATVVAATPLDVVHFTDDAVSRLCREVPAFRQALARTVAERLGA